VDAGSFWLLNTAPTNLWATLVLSFIAALLAIIQWTLMALCQAGLLVLAAMVPLAASASLIRATRGWLDRLMGWLLAIAAYKPQSLQAALISVGRSSQTLLFDAHRQVSFRRAFE
jgi:type IV secretion system protein TrbL